MKLDPRVVDMTGKRIGRLTVEAFAGSRVNGRSHAALWRCRCDCGRVIVATGWSLRAGKTRSCGCGIAAANRRRRRVR